MARVLSHIVDSPGFSATVVQFIRWLWARIRNKARARRVEDDVVDTQAAMQQVEPLTTRNTVDTQATIDALRKGGL